jgi:hypothetical protein
MSTARGCGDASLGWAALLLALFRLSRDLTLLNSAADDTSPSHDCFNDFGELNLRSSQRNFRAES